MNTIMTVIHRFANFVTQSFGNFSRTKIDVHVFKVATFDRISILTRKVTHQFATTNMDALLSMEVTEPCLTTKLLQSIATVMHQVSTLDGYTYPPF